MINNEKPMLFLCSVFHLELQVIREQVILYVRVVCYLLPVYHTFIAGFGPK